MSSPQPPPPANPPDMLAEPVDPPAHPPEPPAPPGPPIIDFDGPSSPQAPAEDQPVASSSTSSQPIAAGDIQVFNPPGSSGEGTTPSTPSELDDAFFEPTLSDVQAHHASVLARSRRLNEAPLLTSKHRDAEREAAEKRKKERWPTTTIRVKFSDGRIIQSTFPSTSPIQPVYEFVRSALNDQARTAPFILWQPPKTFYPERPPPPSSSSTSTKKPAPPPKTFKTPIITPANYGPLRAGPPVGGTGGRETLNELGLVPQSVLLIRWEGEAEREAGWNGSGYGAPLREELLERGVELPKGVPRPESQQQQQQKTAGGEAGAGKGTGEKKIPKWLQKGLMKKK